MAIMIGDNATKRRFPTTATRIEMEMDSDMRAPEPELTGFDNDVCRGHPVSIVRRSRNEDAGKRTPDRDPMIAIRRVDQVSAALRRSITQPFSATAALSSSFMTSTMLGSNP